MLWTLQASTFLQHQHHARKGMVLQAPNCPQAVVSIGCREPEAQTGSSSTSRRPFSRPPAWFDKAMSGPKRRRYIAWGVSVALIGTLWSFVTFIKPWRSCPEIDDSSAGCPVPADESILLFLGLCILLVGVGLLAKGLLTPLPGWEPKAPPGPRDFGARR